MLAERLDFMGRARDRHHGLTGGNMGRGGDLYLVFPASQTAVRMALTNAMSAFRGLGIGRDVAGMAELVLAEALNNIVEHAYADRGHGIIELSSWRDGPFLRFRILDDGIPMPDGTLPIAKRYDFTVEYDDLPEGGFGWAIIHDLTLDLVYRRDGTRNELCFAMAIAGDAA